MPDLVFAASTPNPLKAQFVFSEGKRRILFVDEGAPDDGAPFIFLNAARDEPHVTARCSTYSRLDPPYYLAGATSSIAFATVQYSGPRQRATDLARPLEFKVVDLSDYTEFIWTEQTAEHALVSYSGRHAVIASGKTKCGEARLSLGGAELVSGRHAQLTLTYLTSASEVNTLLHLSAFAFILTRYYSVASY